MTERIWQTLDAWRLRLENQIAQIDEKYNEAYWAMKKLEDEKHMAELDLKDCNKAIQSLKEHDA